MNFKEFKKLYALSNQDISKEIFHQNRERIQIKKEKIAINKLEKIFDAVFYISYKKGFQSMTMRDLSQKTSMSLGSLYDYVSGKKMLLEIIQTQGWYIVKKDLNQVALSHKNPHKQLKSMIKAHVFLSELFAQWFYFTFMEARSFEGVKSMEEYTQKLLTNILAKGEEQGVFKSMDHALTASMIKAMQQEWYLKRWKYKNLKISVDQYADHLIKLVESFCLV